METFVRREMKFRILLGTSALQATDPRDHVYGLFDVMEASAEIVPDYSRSVGFVYCQWTRWLAASIGDLRILAEAGIGASREDAYGLPSWVPDWHSSRSSWNWPFRPEGGANIGLERIFGHRFEFVENTNALNADGVKLQVYRL